MPPAIPAHEIYRTYMAEAKLRIISAEKVLGAITPISGFLALDVEFCYLQIRHVVEIITFGAMVKEESRYISLRGIENSHNPKDHGDASKDWQSPEILKKLVSLSPHVLPIPYKPATKTKSGTYHFDRQKLEVNHSRLIDLYSRSGGFLHAKNPIGQDFNTLVEKQRKSYQNAPATLKRDLKFLRQMLWQHITVTLEPAGHEDPRTPGDPKFVWVIDFGRSFNSDPTGTGRFHVSWS
jgi:hypothetical protein